ncbi:hypothetical protein PM082_024186 [Marasmius tenuissimus]|nr:hypothetical protein PM082_024186 [Marasmius tenuissimus]
MEFVKMILASLHVLMDMFLTLAITRKILFGTRRTVLTNTPERYRTLALLLVESCLLYHIAWIEFIVCGVCNIPNLAALEYVLTQVVGIAPTLSIVRANVQTCSTYCEAPMTISVEQDIIPDVVQDPLDNVCRV